MKVTYTKRLGEPVKTDTLEVGDVFRYHGDPPTNLFMRTSLGLVSLVNGTSYDYNNQTKGLVYKLNAYVVVEE